MSQEDATTVGLTSESHDKLKQFKKDGIFKEMIDGYKFGIALAIAYGNIAPDDIKTTTILNIGSLDPDDKLKKIIVELFPEATDRPYSFVERLAEWGVSEMGRLLERGGLNFSDIYNKVQQMELANDH